MSGIVLYMSYGDDLTTVWKSEVYQRSGQGLCVCKKRKSFKKMARQGSRVYERGDGRRVWMGGG